MWKCALQSVMPYTFPLPQSAPSPKVVSRQQRYSALYDYNAVDYDEVSFIKGTV